VLLEGLVDAPLEDREGDESLDVFEAALSGLTALNRKPAKFEDEDDDAFEEEDEFEEDDLFDDEDEDDLFDDDEDDELFEEEDDLDDEEDEY
jgi:hypothetical protein